MADYSYSDINEAKRRVQEMKSKAKEQSAAGRGDNALTLISSLKNKRDKAFALSLMYLLSADSDESLLSAIIYFLFN